MRILLQFPEGLKQKALEYARSIEKEGNEVFVSASPTFGACDLALDEARAIGADKLVHFGHSEFSRVDFNVEYVPYSADAPLGVLEESLKHLEGMSTIGIVTTVQHVHQLDAAKDFYEKHGKSVLIGKPGAHAKFPGQILGCDPGSAASVDGNVDAHVYFGAGLFHPLGALLATKKPFFVADPYLNKVQEISSYRETYRKRSRGKVLGSLDAKSFAIMVSTKNGQSHMPIAMSLKKKAEDAGLEAQIIVANTFDFESLGNMRCFDAFVNTACPRLSLDDTERMGKPLLGVPEFEEVLRLKAEQKATRTA